MKSRKVKAFNARKRSKPDLPLEDSDSDVNPDDFFHDEIDDLNQAKEDELSTDDELIQHRKESSDEEEVLPITDDETDDSEDDNLNEEEDEDNEHDLPNREAWGKKKSAYYSADFVDEDRGRTYREEDAEAAKAEAEEAFAIQRSVYSNINADNLGANLFLEGSGESSDDEQEKVDLLSATKEEKLKYLSTETKILEYCEDFKLVIQELKKFTKLANLVELQKIKSEEFEKYIRLKKGVLSLYCLNLNVYMMLASSGQNVKNHPVVERIKAFKKILEDLKPTDSVAATVIDEILEKESSGESVLYNELETEDNIDKTTIHSVEKDAPVIARKEKKVKKNKVKHIETETEKEITSLINEVKKEMKKRKLEELDDEIEDNDNKQNDNEDEMAIDQDENGDDKRFINYQIAKNKGLVPHRKKEYRNPRVRHRMKFRKAQIRRKGQVRGVYKEIKRYEGEPTGINTNVVKSIKFK